MNTEFLLMVAGALFFAGMGISYISAFSERRSSSLELRVEKLLPGINCGQCGYPGCSGYAKALSEGKAAVNLCRPAGADVAKQLASTLGIPDSDCDSDEDLFFSPREVAYS